MIFIADVCFGARKGKQQTFALLGEWAPAAKTMERDGAQANSANGILSPTIVINGQVVGTWKRTLKKGSVVITPSPFTRLKKAEKHALTTAAHQYGAFLELPVMLAKVYTRNDDHIL